MPIRWLKIVRLNAACRARGDTLGSSAAAVAIDEPGKPARDRGLAAFAQDVRRHRPVRDMCEAHPVETRKQRTHVAIAEIGLVAGRGPETRKRQRQDAAGAVAAAREPDGIDRRIVGDLHERVGAGLVFAGEMAVLEEALRMEDELGARAESPRAMAFTRSAMSGSSRDAGATMPIRTLQRPLCCSVTVRRL